MKRALFVMASLVVAGLVCTSTPQAQEATKDEKKMDTRVFELRTYYAAPGKMNDLNARFRDHTVKLFEKHGMTIVGFWTPLDPKQADQKLIYILSYPSKAAADKSWKEFQADPVWTAARNESEKNGKLTTKVESVYMNPTDYSVMK